MRAKPVIPRTRATRDIDEAIDFLLDNSAAQVARGFITALERAFAHISQHAATGSPHYALALNLPGLRCWPVKRFPYLIFYLERHDHIDVWRVLHSHRDIPAWLRDPEDS
ncbi:MAG: type II toxin-antitoxin system RelE/ParE family toxin [Gammaproteobacteria bacterium]|jgi:toxin ParE1/3/4|nr:type II toxin-antitoxin system RelE/ParE family toxin [Gammaproteobacteria bacterium]